MKKLGVVFLAAVLIIIFSIVGYPSQSKVITNEYFEVIIGSKYNDQLQVVENKKKFMIGDEIYYSIKPVKALSDIDEVKITVKTKDGKQEIQSEKFNVYKNKLTRPINPIEIEKEGSYAVEVSADSKILSRNFFNVKK